jgi:virginiamycin B lyase
MKSLVRCLGIAWLFASLAAAFFSASRANAATTGVISGTVKGLDGAPFKGAFVRAQSQKTKINFIVLSDKQGKFQIEDLAPGDYDVRASTVDFKTDPHAVSLTADKPAVVDFALQKANVHWPDISNQQGKMLLPDGPGKTVLFTRCMSCHGLQTKIAANRFDEDGWRAAMALMRDPNGVGDTRITDQEVATLAPYLAKVFGVDSVVSKSPADLPGYMASKHPEFSDDAMKIKFVQYDLPLPNRIPWVATPNFRKEGNVWFVESWNSNGFGKIVPDTGEIDEVRVSAEGRRHTLHIHSASEGPDGIVWFAEANRCQLNKYDPATKKISSYVPPSCGGKAGNGDEGGDGPSEVRVDKLGNVWANAGNLWRFDPKTEKFTEFPEGGDAYGFVLDEKDGNLFFAQLWAGKIGKVDIKTLKLKRWDPPATVRLAAENKNEPDEVGNTQVHPKVAGPRRISSDSKGMIWFGEWFAGQLGRFDPTTEKFTEFPLPGPAPTPYGVGVDANDNVWYASYDTDVLGRLDPKTGKVTEYPLPYSGNEIREILQDVDGRMWFGTSFNNKVGYFIPPEGLKKK